MKIEMDKQYTTRDGKKVKIFMLDGGGSQPVIGVISDDGLSWQARCWNLEGLYKYNLDYSDNDLVEVATPKKLYECSLSMGKGTNTGIPLITLRKLVYAETAAMAKALFNEYLRTKRVDVNSYNFEMIIEEPLT